MSGLSEAELHVQAMRLVCEALQDREQDGLEVDWDVIRQMHDQMDAMLQALQHKHRYDSSEIVDLRKDRDHWKQARQDAHEAGELMRAEIETLRKQLADAEHPPAMAQQRDEIAYLRARLDEERSVSAGLRQQLDAANAAWNLQCAGIERLQAFVWKVRSILPSDSPYSNQLLGIEAALKTLDAGTEPTPVAEPAPCPECEQWQRAKRIDSELIALQKKRIERLQAFVGKARLAMWPEDLKSALTELDAVAEPLDAEGGA